MVVSRPPTMTAAEDIMRKFFWEQGKEYGSLQGELYRVASGAPVRVLVAYLRIFSGGQNSTSCVDFPPNQNDGQTTKGEGQTDLKGSAACGGCLIGRLANKQEQTCQDEKGSRSKWAM